MSHQQFYPQQVPSHQQMNGVPTGPGPAVRGAPNNSNQSQPPLGYNPPPPPPSHPQDGADQRPSGYGFSSTPSEGNPQFPKMTSYAPQGYPQPPPPQSSLQPGSQQQSLEQDQTGSLSNQMNNMTVQSPSAPFPSTQQPYGDGVSQEIPLKSSQPSPRPGGYQSPGGPPQFAGNSPQVHGQVAYQPPQTARAPGPPPPFSGPPSNAQYKPQSQPQPPPMATRSMGPPMMGNQYSNRYPSGPSPPVGGQGFQPQPMMGPPTVGPPAMGPPSMANRYPPQGPGIDPSGQQPSQPYYGAGGVAPSIAPQASQQQRLDPDAMPSVVQVIEDDKAKYCNASNVIFTTTIPAAVPPLVTTVGKDGKGIIEDGGCVRPNHMRATVYQVPATEDVLKTTSIPLSIVVKPFEEEEVEGIMNVPVTQSEILRCNRCKAYMNPFMRFIDGGRRFQCSLCRHISEVSSSYFAHLDHTGQRLDRYERPELCLGSYEFRATSEFCRNNILNCRRPHIVFAFELTVNSRPIISQIAKELPDIIRSHLPTDTANPGSPPPLVGFMTYNSKIQMYDVANNGHAHIICDVANTFPPFTSFLVDPITHADQIESFLTSLPTLFSNEELETETILGPVIEAALQTCQVDNSNWFPVVDSEGHSQSPKDALQVVPVGKVYLFHCTLPTYGQDGVTPGRLKPRWTTSPEEIRKLLGTDKEKLILAPESSKYYNNLAQRCVTEYGSGIELFLFPPVNGSFLDIATLSEMVRLTGTGSIFKYYNDPSNRFLEDLKYSLKSSFAFDATMKVRTSTGIRAFEYVGNFFSRTTSDIECATINAGSSFAVEMRYDDKLPEDEFVVVQVATLYTSLSGERRVRIHNLALSVCQTVADVYRNACCDTITNLLIRQSVSALRLGDKTVQQVKEALITRGVAILSAYRRHCAQPGSSLGQLILPEALKLLPMYITGALKCDAIDGGPEMMPDDKAYAQIKTLGAGLSATQVILYPRLLRFEYEEGSDESLQSVHIRCSSMRINNATGLGYLLENGFYLFLYIPTSMAIPRQQQFLKNTFGVDSLQQIQPDAGLPELLTQESQFIHQLIDSISKERRKAMRAYIVRQGMDKLEPVFRSFLYEDKKTHMAGGTGESGKYEAPSYVDLLCHLHKEIRAQLN